MAFGISERQAFRDGNRRTARAVVQTYLANNGMTHLSPVGNEDHMLARYLNGTVDGNDFGIDRYVDLFTRRLQHRTPRAAILAGSEPISREYLAANDVIDDWLHAEDDTAADFVFQAGVVGAWAQLSQEERARLRALTEAQINGSRRAQQFESLPS